MSTTQDNVCKIPLELDTWVIMVMLHLIDTYLHKYVITLHQDIKTDK